MKMVYICGKITGDPNYREKFHAEEKRLLSLGYCPVNPSALVPGNEEWPKAMKKVLRAMLQCAGLSLLPGWKKSRGAKIEVRLARALKIEIRKCAEWV